MQAQANISGYIRKRDAARTIDLTCITCISEWTTWLLSASCVVLLRWIDTYGYTSGFFTNISEWRHHRDGLNQTWIANWWYEVGFRHISMNLIKINLPLCVAVQHTMSHWSACGYRAQRTVQLEQSSSLLPSRTWTIKCGYVLCY